MNNKEAAKALLEGKTLRIVNKTKQHQTYRFNKEAIGIELIGHDLFFNIHDFVSDNEWEEVKEPYKKEIITICDAGGYIDPNTPSYYPPISERVNKKYKVTVEEIIE